MNAIKETEKAVMLKLTAEIPHIEKTVSRDIWVPKSLINNGEIKSWFVDKKANEVFGREVWDIRITDANGERVEIEVSAEASRTFNKIQRMLNFA